MNPKRYTLITLLTLASIMLFAQSNMTVQSGGAVTVNGNLVITPYVFVCGNPLIDIRDGKIYSTVLIGSQCWMSQNLNYGIKISGTAEQTDNSIPEKFCQSDNESDCDIYGGLYQWGEMVQYLNGASNFTSFNPPVTGNIKGICPEGWHIPHHDEWTMLTDNLGGESIAGGKLKETGLNHWLTPNTGASNSSGFNGLPGGARFPGGPMYARFYGAFWSSYDYFTPYSGSAFYRSIHYNHDHVYQSSYQKTYGFSVRCLRD